MNGKGEISLGSKVKFSGYSDVEAMDETEILLEGGEVGEVVKIDDKDQMYILKVRNPDFDSSKRKSKKSNPEFIEADVFFEEVEAYDESAKSATKSKGRGRKAAVEAEEGTETEDKGSAEPTGMELAREDPEIIALVEDLSEDELLDLAHDVVEEANSTEYKLGGVLYHVRQSGAYRTMEDGAYSGKGGLEAYINNELGMEYRKAMYLIEIYFNFNKFGVGSEVVSRLGWTKCKEIVRVMTEENAQELIEIAENSTVADLKDTIREDFVGDAATEGTRQTPKRRVTFKFRLFEDQAVGVEQIFAQAKEALGLEDDNQIFEHIATEWAGQNLDVRAQQKSKRAAAKKKAPVKKKVAIKKKAAVKANTPAKRKVAVKKKAATKKAAPRKKVRR